MNEYEKQLLKADKIHVVDMTANVESKEFEVLPVAYSEACRFIKMQLTKQPVLVYSETEFMDDLEDNEIKYTMIDEEVDHDLLSTGLDKRDENNLFKLLVIVDPDAGLRGLDYRAPYHGILMLVLRSFQHPRQMRQAALRVERWKDSGYRRILKEVPLIDRLEEMEYNKKLAGHLKSVAEHKKLKFNAKQMKGVNALAN